MDFYKHNSFKLHITIEGKPAMKCKCGKTFLIKTRKQQDIIAAHMLHAPNLVIPTRQLVGAR